MDRPVDPPAPGPSPSLFERVWLPFFGALTFLVVLSQAFQHVGTALAASELPIALRKDFLQEWTMGRAALSGLDPYAPTQELTMRWLDPAGEPFVPNPSPHPPGILWVALPFAPLSYEVACRAWVGFELVLLGLIIVRTPGGPRSQLTCAGLMIAALAWHPVGVELSLGQINILATFLLVEALRAPGPGVGVPIGSALAVKIAGWPLLIERAWRSGDLRVVGVATGVAAALTLGTAVIVGLDPLWVYVTEVIPQAGVRFRGHEWNISPAAAAWRLFGGTGGTPLFGATVRGPFAAPALAPVASLLAGVAWAAGGIVGARRLRDPQLAGVVLIAGGAVANPVAWDHALVAAVPALVALAGRAARLDRITFGWVVVTVMCAEPDRFFWLTTSLRIAELAPSLAPWAPFLALAPLFSFLSLFMAVSRADRLTGPLDPGERLERLTSSSRL